MLSNKLTSASGTSDTLLLLRNFLKAYNLPTFRIHAATFALASAFLCFNIII